MLTLQRHAAKKHKTRIVPPKSASNTRTVPTKESRKVDIYWQSGITLSRGTRQRGRQCAQVSVCERERKRKGMRQTERKTCKGLWIWQVVTDDPSGGVVCVCVADGMKGQDVSSEQSCQHHREQDSRHVHVVMRKRERLEVREINVH